MKINKIINSLTFFILLSVRLVAGNLPEVINVVVVQLQSSNVGNFTRMDELVRQAKEQGADLVIFPEESVFGWLNPDVFLKAEPIPGKYSEEFAKIAKDQCIWLATGLGEQGPEVDGGLEEKAHHAYNSGILINPQGQIVLHHRQINVVKNAFSPEACKRLLNQDQCNYTPGNLSDLSTIDTPFGKTSILVCADAFTCSPALTLHTLKELHPDFVIVFWGITASTLCECGKEGFNAAEYTEQVANFLENTVVIGANGIGIRTHGKFLPSEYCGTSGYAISGGKAVQTLEPFEELIFFQINRNVDIDAEAM